VTSLVDTQGEASERALPLHVVVAAARRLASGGASVLVVSCPGRLESTRDHEKRLRTLADQGIETSTSPAGVAVDVEGVVLASAGVLSAVNDSDHIALLSWAGPHHILRVSGALLGLADTLTPAAREALWSGAARPEPLQAALRELSEVLKPGWVASWAGDPLSVLAGGDDVLSVDRAIKQCLGLDGPSVVTEGLDPDLVRREATSARSSLPEGPERYPGVDGSLCTRCDACTQVCPTAAVTLPEDESLPVAFDYNACFRCGICVSACPDFAITPSVRSMGAKLVDVEGLRLSVTFPDAAEREAAVPMAAALELGSAAIDAPP